MQSELAVQKLNEVRDVVDGETKELVDALARVIMLQQDLSHPMLGAKVTLYLRPPTKERETVPIEDAPDVDSNEWNWQWGKSYTDEDGGNAWFTPKVNEDDPDLIEHEALVIEGNVAGDAPEGPLWDPNKEEYKTADEYPVGTVNVVVAKDYHEDAPDGLKSFSDGYATDVEVYTSITPANGEPAAHQYTPGWP